MAKRKQAAGTKSDMKRKFGHAVKPDEEGGQERLKEKIVHAPKNAKGQKDGHRKKRNKGRH